MIQNPFNRMISKILLNSTNVNETQGERWMHRIQAFIESTPVIQLRLLYELGLIDNSKSWDIFCASQFLSQFALVKQSKHGLSLDTKCG